MTARIGFGGGRLAGCPNQAAATALLRRAVELGAGLIDTADVYGAGVSESRIAAALHPYPEDVTIATKGGFVRTSGGPVPNGHPAHLRAACEASLRRLRADAIDLYQLHTPDPAVPLEESLGALEELRAQGKVRRIGISNVTPDQLQTARTVTEISAVQNGYSVRRRRRFGVDPVLHECGRAGITYLAHQPLALGRLTDDAAADGVAALHGATAGQVALAWLLAQSAAVVPIPGTKSVAHLEENMAAAKLRLAAHELAELEARPTPDGGDG
jgi:aryl-alcohol dehydrogenase-like predicted oxidoreductase